MLQGAILVESLRLGVALDGVPVVVRRLERVDAGVRDQLRRWTLLWFEAANSDHDRLAEALSHALEAAGGWYADVHSDREVTVVFANRVFQYPKGDLRQRANAANYARSVGVPEEQLDWTE